MFGRITTVVALALLIAACGRSADGLGPEYKRYQAANEAGKTEEALRHFYRAYLDALSQRKPELAQRFFRNDVEPKARAAVRMGLEFTKVLRSIQGEIVDIKDLVGRAMIKTSEVANYDFRGLKRTDRRKRTYHLRRIGGEWYIDVPAFLKTPKRR